MKREMARLSQSRATRYSYDLLSMLWHKSPNLTLIDIVQLKMHYTGTLAEGGKQFDSSRSRGDLFEVTIGVGQVIKGWDEGVPLLSLGERATLHISADYGYGASGAGADIPPNAALEFDVRLVAINGKQSFYSEEHLATFDTKMNAWKVKELKKYDEKEAFKAKKDEKHGGREQFEAHLTAEVASSVAEINVKPKADW